MPGQGLGARVRAAARYVALVQAQAERLRMGPCGFPPIFEPRFTPSACTPRLYASGSD